MITRFAPTPSGYLHAGNAVNALLVAWLAAAAQGRVVLRIDDMDATRSRPEYIDDVFRVLHWLGVEWDSGPRDRADFDLHFSARHRREYYRAELAAGQDRGLQVYACSCSRRDMGGTIPAGGCPGECRQRHLSFSPGHTALRVHVPRGTAVAVAEQAIALDDVVGDFVVWRRDDLPAYHLASVVEDRNHQVTHVVRGMDLLPSTAAQLFLADYLDAPRFTSARFIHHDLLVGPDGGKLSKSQATTGTPLPATDAERHHLITMATRIGKPWAIGPTG